MVNRLNYYRMLKQIHLISSVILLMFIFVFLITGIVIVNRNLFEVPEIEATQSKVLVDRKMTGSPEKYAEHLKDKFGFKGRQTQTHEKNGNYNFQFNFQGENHQITLTPAQDTLYIKSNSQKMTLLSVSTKLHHMRGFTGGWEYTLWAIFYDLAALSLIVFAITGILMWLKLRMRYTKGLWYLAAGFVLPLAIVFLFWFWR